MANTLETWYRSTLAAKLNATDTTITVATAPTVTAWRMHIYSGSTHAWIKYTWVTSTTLTGVTFVSQTADPATAVTWTTFTAWTSIELVGMHDQLIDKQQPTSSNQIATTYATTTARDTALWANWVATQPYVDIYVTATNLFYNYNLVTGQWESVDTGTSPVTSIVGEIRMFSGSSAPAGWFICDWTAVSRATYSDLFAITSTLYWAGNWTTTFNIPDLKWKIAVGLDAGQTEFDVLWETGGAKTHTLSVTEIPAHTHTVSVGSSSWASGTVAPWNSAATTVTTSNWTWGWWAHNNLQPYLTINYIIKY